ncbi:MAG: tetratricopeptide repeat-containing sensor histidine kinase [Candidatus Cloacimonas sp.]|jgi:signal transduction histidine kinase|nr:tetratricopeptide repeat-containing sensor histidine kinase [Candidatus Cloacimonas sp.]
MKNIKYPRLSETEIAELNSIKNMLIDVPQSVAIENYAKITELVNNRDFGQHREFYIELMFLLGEYNGRNEYIPDAQEIFKRLMIYSTKHKLTDHMLRAKANYAITKAQTGHFHEAIDEWKGILEHGCPLKTRLNLLNNICVGYGTLGEYSKSIDYAFQAIETMDANSLPEMKLSPLINLGSAYDKLGDSEKAFNTWLEAYNLAVATGQIRRACECCSNLSMACNVLGDTTQAMKYAKQCLQIGKDYLHEQGFGHPYNNLGFIYESAGNLDEALKYYCKAKDIFDNGFDKQGSANCQINIASIYQKKGDYKMAVYYLSQAETLAEELDIPILHNRVCTLFAETYAKLERWEDAYKYQNKLANILSSTLEEHVQNSITKIEAEFYRQKIANQAEQYRLQNVELTKKNKIISTKTKELTQTNRNLTDTVETLNRVISVISHDLRAPLANIAKLTELILESSVKKEDIHEMLQDLCYSSRDIYELIDEMLDGIRLQRRSLDAATMVAEQDVITILNSIVSIYRPLAQKKFIFLDCLYEEKYMPARVDSDLLKIVIRNLLNNAVKFTPEKGKIMISAVYNNNQLVISINDSGIGISPKVLKQIQKGRALQRIDSSTNQGIGLGFALCRASLKKMNAKLEIESEPALGTKIRITLPR